MRGVAVCLFLFFCICVVLLADFCICAVGTPRETAGERCYLRYRVHVTATNQRSVLAQHRQNSPARKIQCFQQVNRQVHCNPEICLVITMTILARGCGMCSASAAVLRIARAALSLKLQVMRVIIQVMRVVLLPVVLAVVLQVFRVLMMHTVEVIRIRVVEQPICHF